MPISPLGSLFLFHPSTSSFKSFPTITSMAFESTRFHKSGLMYTLFIVSSLFSIATMFLSSSVMRLQTSIFVSLEGRFWNLELSLPSLLCCLMSFSYSSTSSLRWSMSSPSLSSSSSWSSSFSRNVSSSKGSSSASLSNLRSFFSSWCFASENKYYMNRSGLTSHSSWTYAFLTSTSSFTFTKNVRSV